MKIAGYRPPPKPAVTVGRIASFLGNPTEVRYGWECSCGMAGNISAHFSGETEWERGQSYRKVSEEALRAVTMTGRLHLTEHHGLWISV